MELKPIRIKSCFNLCGALASVLLCILGSANNSAALLLRTLLHSENGNRMLLWCGAIFEATPSICLHFMPFVPLFCVCACVPLEKPQELMTKPVLENLIRCKKNNNNNNKQKKPTFLFHWIRENLQSGHLSVFILFCVQLEPNWWLDW